MGRIGKCKYLEAGISGRRNSSSKTQKWKFVVELMENNLGDKMYKRGIMKVGNIS